MNATASDAADNLSKAGRDAAADFRKHGQETAGFASDELRAFIADVEELVRKIANISDAEIARVRVRVANALSDARRIASDTAENIGDRARVAMDATNDYVRERPWTAIGLAAALGLLIGVGVTAASRRN
jgi:ElaB/YqjD/DUF883 family membrane-anchored ribosome-binding protein